MTHLPLAAFGLEGAAVTPLEGGMINRSYRIDAAAGAFVLKEYLGDGRRPGHLDTVWPVQFALARAGFPVPRLLAAIDGSFSVTTAEGIFTLSEFVDGAVYPPGTMSAVASRRLGEMLGHMHRSLAEADLPPCAPNQLAEPQWIEQHLVELLAIGNARREANPVDEAACTALEHKLRDIRGLTRPETTEWQWTHGDYEWRNVLFDAGDNIVAIFDFDEARCYIAGREVLRCRELSFPHGAPEARVFLEGYAATSGITPQQARSYVENWRYASTYRTWPATVRYLDPPNYQMRWDELLRATRVDSAADWQSLADQFAEIAKQGRW